MEIAVIRIEGDGLLACRDRAVPIVHGEVSAAKEIIGSRVIGRRVDAAAQRPDGFVDLSGGEQFERSVSSQRECRQQQYG